MTAAQARAAGYPDAKTAQAGWIAAGPAHLGDRGASGRSDRRPELAADDRLTDADIRRSRPAWPAGRGELAVDRRYLEMIGTNEAIRAPGPGRQVGLDVPRQRQVRQLDGSGPDHQPRRRLPALAARAGVPAAHLVASAQVWDHSTAWLTSANLA